MKGGLERWMVWLPESLSSLNFEVEYINASGVTQTRWIYHFLEA